MNKMLVDLNKILLRNNPGLTVQMEEIDLSSLWKTRVEEGSESISRNMKETEENTIKKRSS